MQKYWWDPELDIKALRKQLESNVPAEERVYTEEGRYSESGEDGMATNVIAYSPDPISKDWHKEFERLLYMIVFPESAVRASMGER